MKLQNKNKGFTLIELLVVIAIIGVLSGVVLNGLQGARKKARNTERLSTVNQLRTAMELYATASGTNRLPAVPATGSGSGAANIAQGFNTQSYCLGATAACGGTSTFNSTLNTEIEKYISGGKIPNNPTFATTGVNAWYRYLSAAGGTSTTGGVFTTAVGTQCQSTTSSNCPPGAYLMWTMERSGGASSCGPGIVAFDDPTTAPNSYSCVLRIGDKVSYK